MNIKNPETVFQDQDIALRERIRAEMRALLNEHEALAELEKTAAISEKGMRVAHDIRSPLATIAAVCAGLILETQDPEQRGRLQLISSQVDRLSSALATAVDAPVDSADEPIPLDVGDLVRSVINLMQYQSCDDLTFHLFLGTDLLCRLPERSLTRSLYQLVRNAADASREQTNGQVLLDCRKGGSRMEISVMDNGPGLPKALVEGGLRAFASSHSGAALGLSSVERFAVGLGGHLAFSNRETGGAEVTMLLPVDCLEPTTPHLDDDGWGAGLPALQVDPGR